jgi:hypothetical protein
VRPHLIGLNSRGIRPGTGQHATENAAVAGSRLMELPAHGEEAVSAELHREREPEFRAYGGRGRDWRLYRVQYLPVVSACSIIR